VSEVVEKEIRPENVRVIRLGHGANCSSIGSVVDTLFVSAVVGGAVIAAVLAALKKEAIAAEAPKPPDPTEEGTKLRD
jgi:hypothetical protein